MLMIEGSYGIASRENAGFYLSKHYEQVEWCPLIDQFAQFRAKWLEGSEESTLDIAIERIQEVGANFEGVYKILSDRSMDLKMMEEEFGKWLCHIFFEKPSPKASPEERATHIATMRQQLSDPCFYQDFFSIGNPAFLHFLEEEMDDWFEMGLAFSFEHVPHSLAHQSSALKERDFFQIFAKVRELRRPFYMQEVMKERGYFLLHPIYGRRDWLNEGIRCSFKKAVHILTSDPARTQARLAELSRHMQELGF